MIRQGFVGLAPHVLSGAVIGAIEQGGEVMSKPTLLVLTLIALLVGFTACAKYPVVVNASAPAPIAGTPAPAR
jgi:hypothetical protein